MASIYMPVVAPLADQAASMLIPAEVRNAIQNLLPDALVGGFSGAATAGLGKYTLGFGGGITGGIEGLWSPKTGCAALYGYWGGIVGWQGGAGASASTSLYGGIAYGPYTSKDYTGPFIGVHLTFGHLGSRLARKIRDDISIYASKAIQIVDTEGLFDPEALKLTNDGFSQSAKNLANAIDPKFNPSLNICWARGSNGQLVISITAGASATIGKSSKYVAVSRTEYTQFLPDKEVPFR